MALVVALVVHLFFVVVVQFKGSTYNMNIDMSHGLVYELI
jgi:hypothetical protein